MLGFLKKQITHPPIENLIEKELYEARRSLMEAETGLEWAQSMVAYNKARIARLEEMKNVGQQFKVPPNIPQGNGK